MMTETTNYHIESPGYMSEHPATTISLEASFDAGKYLTFEASKVKQHSFESLGLPPCELGDICVTDPFPLFSVEAVAAMRAEIFRHDTLDKSLVSNSDPEYKRCANVIRGYADPGTFNHALWTAPETIKAISLAAGLDVVPVMNMEIGHINVQTAKGQPINEIPADPRDAVCTPITEHDRNNLSDEPLDGWHKDSYPVVCIVMLSDAERMIGGETAIKKGDGTVQKIKAPGLGHAVVLAGGYTEHAALKALGGERIVAVTSLRAKNPQLKDDSHLRNVMYMAGGPQLQNLRKQFVEYRMKLLSERMMSQAEAPVDDSELALFVKKQIEYLQKTYTEAFPQNSATAITV